MAPPPLPDLPIICLEPVEDRSPADPGGFLRLVRRAYRARYPDGSVSEPFVYDEVDRPAIDAVVIAAHYLADDVRHVYLRSVIRPPIEMRDAGRSPLPEAEHLGNMWELPAGLVEPKEQSAAGVRRGARRELLEELGFDVSEDALQPLGPSTFPAPGVLAERHFYFEVEVDPATRREPENDGSPLEHFGAVVAVPLADALAWCAEGMLEDAKTELALRRLAEKLG